MKKISIAILIMFFTSIVYAGFEGLNGSNSINIFSRINCGAGITCTRTVGGVFHMVSSPTVSGGSLTLGDGTAADGQLDYDGNAVDFSIGLEDATDKLKIGLGTTLGTTERMTFNSGDLHTILGDATAADILMIWDGNAQDFHVGIDDSADKLVIGLGSVAGTTERMTFNSADLNILLGDATAADMALIFDGNAQDFSVGMDDSADKLTIALGSVLGTTNRMAFNSADLNIVLGDATAADMALIFDGNAQNFSVGMDDSADKLTISLGDVLGTTNRMAFNSGDLNIVLGDATAADVGFIYDGIAQDYNISLDDSTDDLVIGLGSTAGTTDAMRIDENQDVTIVQDLLPLSTITGDGGAALVGMLNSIVTASTTTLTIAQCGSTIVYGGAFVMTLPEASTALGCRYTFVVNAVANMDINPNDGTDQILLLTNAAGDAIRADAVGESVVLEAVSADAWAPIGAEKGTWTDID